MVLDQLSVFSRVETRATRTRPVWDKTPTEVNLYDAEGRLEKKLGLAIACPNIARPWHPLFSVSDPNKDIYSNDWLQSLVYYDPAKYRDQEQAKLAVLLIAAGLHYAAPVLEGQDSCGCSRSCLSDNVQELIVDAGNKTVSFKQLNGPFHIFSVIEPVALEKDGWKDDSPERLPMVASEIRLVRQDENRSFRTLIKGLWKDEYEIATKISDANGRKATCQGRRDEVERRIAIMAGLPTESAPTSAVRVFNRPKFQSQTSSAQAAT